MKVIPECPDSVTRYCHRLQLKFLLKAAVKKESNVFIVNV